MRGNDKQAYRPFQQFLKISFICYLDIKSRSVIYSFNVNSLLILTGAFKIMLPASMYF